jgi:adrenodoxin-NADP+ reductase
LKDLENNEIPLLRSSNPETEVEQLLKRRGIMSISFDQWKKIESVENERGKQSGKPREKVTSLKEMLNIVST